MPVTRALGSRVQHHFSPLTVRTIFKHERFLVSPPTAYNIIYSIEPHTPAHLTIRNLASGKAKSIPLIPKPPGEVTRLKRGGYNLQDQLQWDEQQYHSVQVSISLYWFFFVFNTSRQKTLGALCDDMLDLTQTWPKQRSAKKKKITEAASKATAMSIAMLTKQTGAKGSSDNEHLWKCLAGKWFHDNLFEEQEAKAD